METTRITLRQRLRMPDRYTEIAEEHFIPHFVRGLHALNGHRTILSNDGLAVLGETERRLTQDSINWEDFLASSRLLPSVENPKLDLFIDPFSAQTLANPHFSAFRAEFNEGGGYRILQITRGCEKQCLFCSESAEGGKLRFLPYPMVLATARRLIIDPKNPIKIMLYDGNDPLMWRDLYFDADFADLAFTLRRMGADASSGVTHGFSPHDRYATEAAEKLAEGNARQIRTLADHFDVSVHLFHDDVFPFPGAAPKQSAMTRWAQKFAHAIETLQPARVRLLSDDESKHITPGFSLDFIRDFYQKQVWPLLSSSARQRYDIDSSWSTVSLSGIYFEGRMVGSSYFEQVSRQQTCFPAIAYSNISPGLHLKIDPDGAILALHQPIGQVTPEIPPAKTVGQIFPDPTATAFRHFIWKLHYHLINKFGAAPLIWEKFYPEASVENLRALLPEVDGTLAELDDGQLNSIHQALGNFPLTDEGLLSGRTLADSPHDYHNELCSPYSPNPAKKERDFLLSFAEGRQALKTLCDLQASRFTSSQAPPSPGQTAQDILRSLPAFHPINTYGYRDQLPFPRFWVTLPVKADLPG